MSRSNAIAGELIIPLEDITPGENHSRFAPDDVKIKDLMESIRADGLINALVVTPNHDGIPFAPYKLVAGFQRFRALVQLGMPARVTVVDADKAMQINTAENVHRKNLSLMDYAVLIERMKHKGITGREIAKKISQSQSWVSKVAKLVTLRYSIQSRIHKGEIGYSLAATLPDMTEAQQDAEIAKLDSGETKAAKKKAKKEAAKHKGPSVAELLDGIEPLTESPEPSEDGKIHEAKVLTRKREVLTIMAGYLKGKYGAKKLDEKLVEVL